jgi:predicted RNase H-like nuclease
MAHRSNTPYTTIAAVVPCATGWLVLPGRLQAVTVVIETPQVLPSLIDVVDHRPAFDAVALGTPIGFPHDSVNGERGCEREVRELLGWPRRSSIPGVPCEASLRAPTVDEAHASESWVTSLSYRSFGCWREVDDELQPYHQRRVYSAHPELSFHLLNGDRPLTTSPHSIEGQDERLALAAAKLPGIDRIIAEANVRGATRRHLIEAAGLLWTARRIAGRVVNRYPDEPEWNDIGLRMEYVR